MIAFEYMCSYFILVLFVFGFTSGILYSELVSGTRNKWINYWKKYEKHDNRFVRSFSKLQYYGICQLCLGTIVALVSQFLFLPFIGNTLCIAIAISVGGCSWLLGSITLFFQHGKAWFARYENK